MTTKEKAKAYDEALKQVKKELAACGSMNCDAARLIFRLFPEQLDAEWKELEKWNHVGPTVEEYFHGIKPTEWSEEDDKMLQRIIRHTESEYQDWCNDKYGNSEIVSDGKRSCLERLDWLEKQLKSLRPQPNIEIYQAAKRDLAIKFMNYLDENRPEGKMSLSNGECEDIDKAFKENDWAKIIRYIEKYQPHWKPSNEQINYLGAAVIEAQRRHNESVTGFPRYRVLKELYEQLLKL